MSAMVRSFVAALVLATPAFAWADDSYLKVGVARSAYDFGSGTPTEHKTGYQLAYGAMADANWGAEVGYVDFGAIDASTLDDVPTKLKVRSLYAAGIGAYPLAPQASVYGKLGIAVKRYSLAGENETRASPLFGLGARWDFSRDWGAALEYVNYGKNEGLTLTQVSLSAMYKF